MSRGEGDKKRLKEKANELVANEQTVEVDTNETTGENDFKYEKFPNVCAVVVDKRSGSGFVQITGGNRDTEIVHTGPGESGFVKIDILDGQSCMLYGTPTVLYIRPRST